MSGTLRLRGSTSGYSELQAPAVAADQTFVLPTAGGTLLTTDSPVPKLTLELGSASQPSLTFQGDTDTGLFSEGTNTLNLVTGGSSKVVLGAAAHTIYAGTGATVRAIDIDSSGNVGVGTSSPSQLLHIYEAATNSQAYQLIENNRSRNAATQYKTTLGSWYVGNGVGADANRFTVYQGGTGDRLVIDSSGNVGIGTTSPSKILHLNGTNPFILIQADSTTGNSGFNFSDGANKGQILYDHNGDYMRFSTNGTSNERMRIDSSGNVGIGTSDPQSIFDIKTATSNGALTQSAFLYNPGTGDNAGTKLNLGVSGGGTIAENRSAGIAGYYNGAGTELGFYTTSTWGTGSQTVRAVIDNAGRVGIGTTGPAAKLDVNGNQTSNVVAMAALNVDCSAGNYFTKTINGNSTFTFSNVPSSRSFSFVLELTHTSGTVTWPASVKFPDDTAPTLTTGKTHLFVFETNDGGTRFRGAALVDYVN